ncbi:hypothetical protein E4T39_03734 [Aureobasidium subglaciale]|nr:hypothetical protein E4T39_03734 [Aureobasidium subglaciale]
MTAAQPHCHNPPATSATASSRRGVVMSLAPPHRSVKSGWVAWARCGGCGGCGTSCAPNDTNGRLPVPREPHKQPRTLITGRREISELRRKSKVFRESGYSVSLSGLWQTDGQRGEEIGGSQASEMLRTTSFADRCLKSCCTRVVLGWLSRETRLSARGAVWANVLDG